MSKHTSIDKLTDDVMTGTGLNNLMNPPPSRGDVISVYVRELRRRLKQADFFMKEIEKLLGVKDER